MREYIGTSCPKCYLYMVHICMLLIAADAHQAGCLCCKTHFYDRQQTERLCISLSVSIRPSCITRMYLVQPSLLCSWLPKETNGTLK